MAAAAVSLSCPPRRSSRLAHAHTAHAPSPPPLRQPHHLKSHRHHRPRISVADSEPDPDSSSSDPENELTPRALRALKRQRLALDFDGLSISTRGRPRKKRKENIAHADPVPTRKEIPQPSKRPSSPPSPLTPKRTFGTDRIPCCENAAHLPSIPNCSVGLLNETGPTIPISLTDEARSSTPCPGPALCGSFVDQSPVSMLTDDANSTKSADRKASDISAPLVPLISTDTTTAPLPSSPPLATSSPESEPLTPLTPLTPSPSPSPSGHDRHTTPSPPSPLNEPLPLPVSIESIPLSTDSLAPSTSHPPPLSADCSQPTLLSPHPSHLSLDPPLDNLLSFDTLPSNFDSGLPLHLDVHHGHPHEDSHPHPHVPQLPVHFSDLQPDQANPPQVQYVRPPFTQVPGRDREVNIWKVACQERVEYLVRRYGIETIKAVVASEARSIVNAVPQSSSDFMPTSSAESPTQEDAAHATQLPQTRFRLYTPASYTWCSRSVLGSGSVPGKRSSNDNPQETELEREAVWAESDLDDMDIDVDMDDDDEDYEDEDELGELEGDVDSESRATLDLDGPHGKSGAAMRVARGEAQGDGRKGGGDVDGRRLCGTVGERAS
ncbi:hypothetical protein EDC04DRAFT_2110706 [Pisolithus marmoratus]|nr:hypothetical protein EDC04DRAFT_2110706 [Pisolithus marmoratus]